MKFTNFVVILILAFPALGSVEVQIDNPIDGDEVTELQDFLAVAISNDAKKDWAKEAEKELAYLERYSFIQCSVQEQNLACHLKRFPIVRNILFSGVPVLILEKELKKHIPIRPGQVINANTSTFNDAIARSEIAIKSFLEREGYFLSSVKTTIASVTGAPASDIFFEVSGGTFLKVRNVTVRGQYPLDPELIARPFRQMCSSIRYGFEGIFQGTKACYNRDIEREKVNDLEDELADLGYPEAHISVERNIVEDEHGKARHLDLTVNVLLGTRLQDEFDFVDAQYLDMSDIGLFFRFISGIEFMSRVFNAPSGRAVYPEDQTILVNQLRDALTFKKSHIVDEGQIDASVESLKEVLSSRGYVNAVVEVASRERLKDNGMAVRFRINPGEPQAVKSIKVLGSDLFTYADVSEDSEGDFLIEPRSAFSSGHITKALLEHDRARVQRFFQKKGFSQAQVRVVLEQASDGLELIYQVDEGKRRLANRIIFSNDDPTITNSYLKTMQYCHNPTILREGTTSIITCDRFPFVEAVAENEAIKLVGVYSQAGYLKATPLFRFEENNGEVTIFFDFATQQMNRAKISELLVDGNIQTHRKVIERELGIKNIASGLNFVPSRLEFGLRKLRSYNVFSKLTLEPIEKPGEPDFYYLFLQLVERPTLGLNLNFTFDSDRLFSISVDLEELNLFGTLLQAETELKFGLFIGRESKFKNTFTWPRFFGVPMDIELTAPELLYEQLQVSSTRAAEERHAQLKTTLAFKWVFLGILHPSLEFLFRVDQWQYDLKPITSFLDLDGLSLVLGEKPTLRGVVKPSLTVSWLDDLFDPRFGYRLKGGLELSGPHMSSDLPYTVFNFEGTGYVSLGPVTFAANARFKRGVINNPSSNWWVLQGEADFRTLGGIFGPRSYGRDTIGIYGPLRNNQGNALPPINNVPILGVHAGDFMLFSSFEMRFPLIQKFLLGKLMGALFTDVGYIGYCDTAFFCMTEEPNQPTVPVKNEITKEFFIPHQFGFSVGVSLRWVLPVGSFAADYAISPIHASTGLFGRESHFNFRFGYMF